MHEHYDHLIAHASADEDSMNAVVIVARGILERMETVLNHNPSALPAEIAAVRAKVEALAAQVEAKRHSVPVAEPVAEPVSEAAQEPVAQEAELVEQEPEPDSIFGSRQYGRGAVTGL